MIENVILDWSGVVSDDWQATFEMVNEVFKAAGRKKISEAVFKDSYEQPWMNFYKKIGFEVDIKKERAFWEKNMPKHFNKIVILPKAKDAVLELKQRGVKLIVFTAKNHKILINELKKYELEGFIDNVHANVDDKREEVEGLIAKHEIEPKKTVYVGDMVHDVETAKMAGITSIAVLSGYDSREKLAKAKPDFILNDLGELPGLIERLDNDSK